MRFRLWNVTRPLLISFTPVHFARGDSGAHAGQFPPRPGDLSAGNFLLIIPNPFRRLFSPILFSTNLFVLSGENFNRDESARFGETSLKGEKDVEFPWP